MSSGIQVFLDTYFNIKEIKPRNTEYMSSRVRDLTSALLLSMVIIGGEFFARRVGAVILPTIFDYGFMDLLCLGAIYLIICPAVYLLQRGGVRQKACYTGFSLKNIVQRNTLFTAIIIIVLGIQVVNRLDLLLFSGINYNPAFISSLENHLGKPVYVNAPMYPEYSKIATSIIFILVNGLWVPVAEEFLWRGVIQTKLSYHTSPWVAITVTSILFSVKHAVVDLVLTRLLFLFVFGLAVGWAKQRTNIWISTLSHGYINLTGTIYWIIGKIL